MAKNVTTNLDKVLTELEGVLDSKLKQIVTLQVATGMLAPVLERIHVEGKDSSNSDIGTYNNTYLKERMKYYNRTADKKIVLSLTKQMELDFSVQAVGDDSYGLGYKNEFNLQKAEWNNNRWGKEIFALTKEEEEKAVAIAKKAFLDAFT